MLVLILSRPLPTHVPFRDFIRNQGSGAASGAAVGVSGVDEVSNGSVARPGVTDGGASPGLWDWASVDCASFEIALEAGLEPGAACACLIVATDWASAAPGTVRIAPSATLSAAVFQPRRPRRATIATSWLPAGCCGPGASGVRAEAGRHEGPRFWFPSRPRGLRPRAARRRACRMPAQGVLRIGPPPI